MKKLSFIVLVLCLVLNLSSGEAKIDDSQIALGGIVPGSRLSEVIKIYGQPNDQDLRPSTSSPWVIYGEYYSKSAVNIYLFPSSIGLSNKVTGKELVQIVSVRSDNGFATPDGIKVGTPKNVLYEKYGEPDFVSVDGNAIYYKSFYYSMCFVISDDVVSRIEVKCQDDYAFKKRSPEYNAMARLGGR